MSLTRPLRLAIIGSHQGVNENQAVTLLNIAQAQVGWYVSIVVIRSTHRVRLGSVV